MNIEGNETLRIINRVFLYLKMKKKVVSFSEEKGNCSFQIKSFSNGSYIWVVEQKSKDILVGENPRLKKVHSYI